MAEIKAGVRKSSSSARAELRKRPRPNLDADEH
jgi:hypothetical protein